MRIPKTATVIISIVTGVAWLLVALVGRDGWAAMTFGFIPARFTGVPTLYAAPPAWLTPLTSTFVHGGALHVALNLLMLVWCGTKVERILGAGALVFLYVVGAFTAAVAQWLASPMSPTPMIGASGAISAVIGAFALSYGEPKRLVEFAGPQSSAQFAVAARRLGRAADDDRPSGRHAGLPAGDSGARRRFRSGLCCSGPFCFGATGRPKRRRCFAFRLEQPVKVDDDIFHFRIVDRTLRAPAPGVFRLGIAFEQTDEVDRAEVDEFEALRIFDAASEHQVKLAHGRSASRIAADANRPWRPHSPLR